MRSRSLAFVWFIGLLLGPIGCRKETDSPPAEAGPQEASQILFFDPDPDPTTNGPWIPLLLDLDQDSIPDVDLKVVLVMDTTVPWPEPLWATRALALNDSVLVSPGAYNGAYTLLVENDPIGEGLHWSNAVTMRSEIWNYSGCWPNGHTGFIGVRMIRDGAIHYAWILLSAWNSGIALHSSGFERVPLRPISAGDTGN